MNNWRMENKNKVKRIMSLSTLDKLPTLLNTTCP